MRAHNPVVQWPMPPRRDNSSESDYPPSSAAPAASVRPTSPTNISRLSSWQRVLASCRRWGVAWPEPLFQTASCDKATLKKHGLVNFRQVQAAKPGQDFVSCLH